MARYLVAQTETQIRDHGIEKAELKGLAELRSAKTDPSNGDELLALARDADVILHDSRLTITGAMMDGIPKLKAIISCGVGFDNIDVEAATERGIVVCNVPDYGSHEVAEHATALILAMERRLFELDRGLKQGMWGHPGFNVFPMRSPSTQVVGLVAFGRIARRVAKRVQACGFKVIAYDPYVPRWDFELADVDRVDDLLELMKRSDFISVHVPHNKQTTHLIGAKEISVMKPTAYFVITGRGKTMDQKALYKALKQKKIAGAALDVFENEPVAADDPILKLENVIVTPHVAGYTVESNVRRRRLAAEIAAEVLKGGRPLTVVNPEVYSHVRRASKRRHRK